MGPLHLHVPRTPAQAPPSCTDYQVTGDKKSTKTINSTLITQRCELWMACQGKGMEKSHRVGVGSSHAEPREQACGSKSWRDQPSPAQATSSCSRRSPEPQWVEQELLFTEYLCARPFDKTLFYKYVSTGINIFVSCQAPFCS